MLAVSTLHFYKYLKIYYNFIIGGRFDNGCVYL